ncbi:MAG: CHASE2 domain-containing protein [Cytophagaceae bacterium]|nr:CHASE2 domain-containing protein [Cytophagaceae bacterium]MDW8455601.1 CHASE2 domain-containing protein [Cytophagaceae bacterium]
MKKKGYVKDAFFATIFSMVFIWGLSKIPLNSDFINPIAKTFEDFDLTDIVFSLIRESPPADTNITVVNIGELDREGIAQQVNILNKYNPKVLAIDARFFKEKKNRGDTLLAEAFSKVKNLVLGCELVENEEEEKIDSVKFPIPLFNQYSKSAYVDMISEGPNQFKTARRHFLRQKIGDTFMLSFASRIAQLYKPESIKAIEERNNDTEIINYSGNIDCVTKDGVPNAKITFSALDVNDVLFEQFERDSTLETIQVKVKDTVQNFDNVEIVDTTITKQVYKYTSPAITGKIVIMGYMGPNFNTYSTVDRFFTPLNKKYVGRSYEDMYGVVVHANIVSMILSGNYIDEMPEWLMYVVNISLLFLNLMLFSYLYFKLELFWDGVSLVLTLLEVLLLTALNVFIFSQYNYKSDFTLIIVALFLMPNIIELYYALARTSELKLRNKFAKKFNIESKDSSTNNNLNLKKDES